MVHSATQVGNPPTEGDVLGRLDNIDILCRDLPAMVAFYRDVLGLPELLGYHEDEGWAGFQAGDVSLFLIAVEADHPGPRAPGAGPAGFESFAFAVDDLEAAMRELEARGVTWAGDVVESQWYRYRSFHDPEGNLLHITRPDRKALGLA
jgi:catechol 2,3-dioxygenase-like lactoylglutathione lyase family enzyme